MRRFLFIIVLIPFVVIFLSSSVISLDLPKTAKAIREGKIKVGNVASLEFGKRFHNIHNRILGINCESCHIEKFAPDYLYQRRYKKLEGPGHVDRGICLGCHKENGPAATKLYGAAGK